MENDLGFESGFLFIFIGWTFQDYLIWMTMGHDKEMDKLYYLYANWNSCALRAWGIFSSTSYESNQSQITSMSLTSYFLTIMKYVVLIAWQVLQEGTTSWCSSLSNLVSDNLVGGTILTKILS